MVDIQTGRDKGLQIRIRGQVQGVGFRPFVWKLANTMQITGTVCNDAEGVLINAYGEKLDAFVNALQENPPPISKITSLKAQDIPHRMREGFEIIESREGIVKTRVTPDIATCEECSDEIFDVNERRHGYAFTNCTNCGPRFTIVESLPYDRQNTAMAGFELCDYCASQYANPADRRFHAQPIACPECGPELDYHGVRGGQAIEAAVNDLRQGRILAIKGIGGFHLVVNAEDEKAITRLRKRKHRPAKPLALMANIARIEEHAVMEEGARRAIEDVSAPIVLLSHTNKLPDSLAPGQSRLGWMLPYTPLHKLLIEAFDGILVMTSGNLSGEPQVIDNEEAQEKLGDIADRFLLHDRPIARRVDDSLVQIFNGKPMVMRRARGFAPSTVSLPDGFENAPQTLGCGGLFKSTLAMVKNGEVLLTHHLGDLDNYPTIEEYEKAFADYSALFGFDAERVVVDLHPEFASTRFGEELGRTVDRVQHHHAHMAAVMAEHRLPIDHESVLGIILDGLGLGTDGTIWGGELLLGGYREFSRVGFLKPAPLPGGDFANRQPWRNALARLDAAGLCAAGDEFFRDYPLKALRAAIDAGVNSPMSSSVGRLFDSFAALLGFEGEQSFEGEAAMMLENLANEADGSPPYPMMTTLSNEIDPSPLFRCWYECRKMDSRSVQAYRFHAAIAHGFASKARDICGQTGTRTIILSGGVMQNQLLLKMLIKELDGFDVLYPSQFPANDGGLSLGQVVIAMARALEKDSFKQR